VTSGSFIGTVLVKNAAFRTVTATRTTCRPSATTRVVSSRAKPSTRAAISARSVRSTGYVTT
jgi:hypothetical protein